MKNILVKQNQNQNSCGITQNTRKIIQTPFLLAGDHNLLFGAGLTGNLAAPLKFTVARGGNMYHPLLRGQTARVTQLAARLNTFTSGGGTAIRVNYALTTHNSLVAELGIFAAIVGAGLQEH